MSKQLQRSPASFVSHFISNCIANCSQRPRDRSLPPPPLNDFTPRHPLPTFVPPRRTCSTFTLTFHLSNGISGARSSLPVSAVCCHLSPLESTNRLSSVEIPPATGLSVCGKSTRNPVPGSGDNGKDLRR